jgi:hypothetical protein
MLRDHKAPYRLGFYFVRDSLRRFDYNNASQVILDLMQEKGIEWLSNDDHTIATPVFLGNHKDVNKCGVYLMIIQEEHFQTMVQQYVQVPSIVKL